MSETIEVQIWGKLTNVSAGLYHAIGAEALIERMTEEWELSARRAGYVVMADPTVVHEPRWWVRDGDGVPMLMPMGEGSPDVYEFRASGPVRERAANEPCEHGSTVEITTLADPRCVLLCNWCNESIDGGPR